MRVKLNEEEHAWRDSAEKYQGVHEEITRRKQESAQLEEALFQVVQSKKPRVQISLVEQMERKQSMKKIFDFFKLKKR